VGYMSVKNAHQVKKRYQPKYQNDGRSKNGFNTKRGIK
jgi:hypothetical protein